MHDLTTPYIVPMLQRLIQIFFPKASYSVSQLCHFSLREISSEEYFLKLIPYLNVIQYEGRYPFFGSIPKGKWENGKILSRIALLLTPSIFKVSRNFTNMVAPKKLVMLYHGQQRGL